MKMLSVCYAIQKRKRGRKNEHKVLQKNDFFVPLPVLRNIFTLKHI